jgi:tripartite ATP-independent transporter DctP family solute receptor
MVVAVLGCWGGMAAGADAGKIVWKFGHVANEDHPWNKVAQRFSEIIETNSGGRLALEIYPNSTLGAEADVLNGIALGTADMTMTGGSFEPYAPVAALLEAPWAYRDENHVKMMLESEIGERIYADFKKAGFIPLFYNLRSPRNLTSNSPVKTPADIKNVKMRLSQTPLQVAMWSAAGASTTSIALAETFTALGQGVVNMQENPYDLIYSNSFFEVQKYANETEHIFSSILYVVGEKQFNALPEDVQKIVLDASKEIQQYANDLYFETKDTYKNLCVENGMQINSDVDKVAFKEVMVPAVKSFFKDDIWELYEKIVALGS